jgi:hypothetical protein
VNLRSRPPNARHQKHSIVPSEGGVLYLAMDGYPTLTIPVKSADAASAILQGYRDRYCIGASDMLEGCGNILTTDGTVVARVSYNGRVWNTRGELLQEAADLRNRSSGELDVGDV